METVSIIIPIYNASNTIEKCLSNIQRQTYRNIEIICIDDGSTDNSMDLVKENQGKDNRIIYISKKNGGVSSARNCGIEIATGKYVTFVDADDIIPENMIEILTNYIKQDDEIDLVKGKVYTKKSYQKEKFNLTGMFNKEKINEVIIPNILKGDIKTYSGGFLIRREKMKNKKFRENLSLMEDKFFFLEILKECNKICLINEIVYYYEWNDNSCSEAISSSYKNIKALNRYYIEISSYKEITNNEEYVKILRNNFIEIWVGLLFKLYKYNKKKCEEYLKEELEQEKIYNFLFNTDGEIKIKFKYKTIYHLVKNKKYKLNMQFMKILKIVESVLKRKNIVIGEEN